MKTKVATKEDYLRRMNVVVEYINQHLDEEMDLKRLAELSNFSEFHFHRIFKAFQHETLAAYITRIRVETAARLLRYSDLSVECIAHNVGYDLASSLSKSFRQFYGVSPTEYRTNKKICIMKPNELNPELRIKAPKLMELPAKTAIYIRFTGEYNQLDFPAAFGKLWAFVKEQKLYTAGIEHICIYHDDPKVTEGGKLRTDVCLVVHKPVTPQGEIGVKQLAGGRYAIFQHTGPYTNLGMVYNHIFAEWLPNSGQELRSEPMLEMYCNDPERTAPEKLKTELYLPIQ